MFTIIVFGGPIKYIYIYFFFSNRIGLNPDARVDTYLRFSFFSTGHALNRRFYDRRFRRPYQISCYVLFLNLYHHKKIFFYLRVGLTSLLFSLFFTGHASHRRVYHHRLGRPYQISVYVLCCFYTTVRKPCLSMCPVNFSCVFFSFTGHTSHRRFHHRRFRRPYQISICVFFRCQTESG